MKNTNTKLACIQQLLREVRDDQTEIPCKNKNKCICNDFDSIIDNLDELKNRFPAETKLVINDPLHILTINYLDKVIERYDNSIGDCGIDKTTMLDWVRWWGNGGGMYSIEYVFNEAIEQSENISELLQTIKDDSYCECGTAILIADVITAMLEDVCKEEIEATLPF